MNIADFYRPIHIENLAVIQNEVLKRIPKDLLDSNNLTYIENNKEVFLGIKELYKFLETIKLNWCVISIAVNIIKGNNQGNIHVDSGYYKNSLNIPITGCENTFIDFFKVNGDYQTIHVEGKKQDSQHHFFKYTDDQCKLIYEGDTSVPYILGTKTPHRVINRSDNTRIMLLIRLVPGPWLENI